LVLVWLCVLLVVVGCGQKSSAPPTATKPPSAAPRVHPPADSSPAVLAESQPEAEPAVKKKPRLAALTAR
jgi:hypothetical protein